MRIYKDTAGEKGVQAVFCDVAVNSDDGKFSVYESIKEELIIRGVPTDEICFAGDATTDIQRTKMFEELRNGEKRIVIGSTAKMGTGVNMQTRLAAAHHLDIPWKPSEHAQDIIGGVAQRDTVNGSVALKLGKRLPDMTSRQKEIPNLSLMAFAYLNEGQTFNEQDTYLRKLSKSAWNNLMLTSQEIYCFVPISKNLIADSNYRVWDNVKEQIVQRLGAALDEAILFGAAGVAGIPPSIYERCVTSGNVIDYGDIGDIYDDAPGTGGLVNLIEEQDWTNFTLHSN
ncbi:hypothetical protein FACS1894188_02280 [Clostridia bacterium]|nr:hypothetical protein FACS1894188_02280 [Clostridia bacterium]